MKKIITIILTLLFLSSCQTEDLADTVEKKDFFVEIKSFSGFTNTTNLEKTGKLSSSQDINLNSNASGRVSGIFVKEGDTVQKGQKLAVLEDNIGSYGLNLEKSKNMLDRAYISYDSTKINLDKQVFDAENNLKTLENNLLALEKNSQEDIKKAKTDLDNANLDNLDSKSSLELQKLDNSIQKAELDYENKLISDSETIDGFKQSIKKEHNSLLVLLDDVIEFGDSLLGVTDLNKTNSDVQDIKDYLGAKDKGQKTLTENLLLDLVMYRDDILSSMVLEDLSEEELQNKLDSLSDGYKNVIDFLNSFETTINNSITSVGTLGDTEISSYIGSLNLYQSSLQGNYTAFLGFQNNVNNFLRTYLNSQESVLKQIDLLKEDRNILEKSFNIGYESSETLYNKVVINSKDSISTLEIRIDSAKNSLENAIKTRDVTLRSLQNTINEANIGYNQALKEYNKLSITSPISGTIAGVSIDVGQEVNTGTPAFSVLSTGTNEVQISFNKKELDFVEEGKEVFIDFEGETYTGSILSISKVADQNLKYISRVSFDDSINLIGNIVSVEIPISLDYKLIPMGIIKISNSGYGNINILENGEIKQMSVELGDIYNDEIEVRQELSQDLDIITSYIDNFDAEKFKLKVK